MNLNNCQITSFMSCTPHWMLFFVKLLWMSINFQHCYPSLHLKAMRDARWRSPKLSRSWCEETGTTR